MSNYIANQLQSKGIGKTFEQKLASLQIPGGELNVRDIQIINDDIVAFESRSVPPITITAAISALYKDQELVHTYNDESSLVYDCQVKLQNGNAVGYRQRYNDGDTVEDYPSWTSVPDELNQKWHLPSDKVYQ